MSSGLDRRDETVTKKKKMKKKIGMILRIGSTLLNRFYFILSQP